MKTLERYARKAVIPLMLEAALIFAPLGTARAVWVTVVDGTSFNSVGAFQGKWSYDYPYGPVHNGTARMNQTNVTVSSGIVTLTSSLTNEYEGTNSIGLTIRYNSGTFYLNQPIKINQQSPVWDISGEFKVPTQTGTWPALWLDGVNSWPPESDIMEFKGSSNVWQNTYNGSWQTQITPVSSASSSWHTYRLIAVLENSTNVDFHYYIDGKLESEQTSTTFVGSPCWLILDYEMENASGSPGPDYTTYVYVSNIVVKCEEVSNVTGPVADGAYKLLARSTGDSLDALNQNSATNSALGQWPYDAGLNEQWILTCLGNSQYSIIGRQSGRALGVLNSSTTNGAGVVIDDYSGENGQKWQLNPASGGYYELINANSGRVLEVSNNSRVNGAVIDQWSSADTTLPQLNDIPFSGTNIVLRGSAGVPGVGYSVLGSPDLTIPVSNWTPIATAIFDKGGNGLFTNGLAPMTPQQFFLLQLTPSSGAGNQQWTFQRP